MFPNIKCQDWFLPSEIGVSWLGVETTSSLPSALTTSHAHPEPKRVVAAVVKTSWKASNEPNASLIAAATSAVGSCFSGDKVPRKVRG